MIHHARGRASSAVNTELVGLYWRIGEYISKKIDAAENAHAREIENLLRVAGFTRLRTETLRLSPPVACVLATSPR